MITDSALSSGKAHESGAGFSTSTSFFASKETNSAICRNEDSCSMPSDLWNQMPDRSPSVSYDSPYFRPSEFEDQSAPTNQAIRGKENPLDHQLGDRHEFSIKALLNYEFREEFRQEGDSIQLILSPTNCECPETSMNRDFNQDQLMQSDVPTIDSEPDLAHSTNWKTSLILQFSCLRCFAKILLLLFPFLGCLKSLDFYYDYVVSTRKST